MTTQYQDGKPYLISVVKQIRKVLEKYPSIDTAILFGSLVTGKYRHGSDLDIAVGADHPLATEEKLGLIMALAESLGRPVDLVDLSTVGEPLLGEILAGGHIIMGGDTRYARILSRHLFNQADFVPYQRRILEERRKAWIGS